MAKIQIEVVYAKQEQQALLKLMVEEGTTAQQAVEQSGILQQFPEIDPTQLKLGIFSKAIKSETVLRERDRVEIYRPLIADPKAVRRSRAEAGKVMKKGGGDA
ncbi:MAG: RnfH family protein [Aquaspirillum sp.]|nr:RnfH family protein [Aquaspirillum sp.]